MENFLEEFGLNKNEIKVYLALLKLKKGTKTPIVNESKILSSKVYEVLERLIRKGLVTYFVENKVKNFVPVHPQNISTLFDEKIQKLENQKKQFTKLLKEEFLNKDLYNVDVQLFRGWKGLKSVFNILIEDFNLKKTYYVLGMNGGINLEQAWRFFPKINKQFEKKNIKRKVILREDSKKESEEFFEKFGNNLWEYKYYPTLGPIEIGISNNFVLISLLEKEPIAILINNKLIN